MISGANNANAGLQDVPIYLYGGKPKHLKTIKQQLRALKRKKLHMLVQGKTYRF